MPTPSNERLITRAQQGDSQAFAALLAEHYDQMFRFAYRFTGNRSDAEDITQNACLKLARSLGQFRFEAAFSSWLYRLVINCAKDWYKSQPRHRQQTTQYTGDEIQAGDDNSEAAVYLRQVLAQLNQLAEGFSETALLVHGEGLSHAEAATILGIKEATVSWRLHEIRKHLQALNAGGAIL